MGIRPLDDRVLLEVLVADYTTPGGIVLPDSARESSQRGKVKAVGDGKRLEDGSRAKPDVKKGDVVLFGKYAGADVKVDGVDYKILRESEILGRVAGA
jgi:chaperonin GroES